MKFFTVLSFVLLCMPAAQHARADHPTRKDARAAVGHGPICAIAKADGEHECFRLGFGTATFQPAIMGDTDGCFERWDEPGKKYAGYWCSP